MESAGDVPGLASPVSDSPTIAVLSAIASEATALRHLLESASGAPEQDSANRLLGSLPSASKGVPHRLVLPPASYGEVSAAMEAASVLGDYPTVGVVAFAGVAGGGKGLRVGDVVVSRRLAHLDEGSREEHGFKFRGYCPEPSSELIRLVEPLTSNDASTARAWGDWLARFLKSEPVREAFPSMTGRLSKMGPPRIYLDTIGTSSSVINDPQVRDYWQDSGHHCRAFEMEGYGVSMAASRFSREYLIVRSISDHAGGDKSHARDELDQPYAAHVAAACLAWILNHAAARRPFVASHPAGVQASRNAIGLFMDVDCTLTTDYIQRHYADALQCRAEYDRIEADWQTHADTERFNAQLIPLFQQHKLTKKRAKEIASSVPLQPWSEKLLRLPVERYLVSSGPSYFIRELARSYRIPQENVVCSDYKFDEDSGLISSCNPVSAQTKSIFIQDFLPRHRVTVGVGDHPRDDGPFLAQVTIPILTRGPNSDAQPSDAYVTAPSHQAIYDLVLKLSSSLE